MITSFYGSPIPQSVHVNNRFSRCDCASQPRNPGCIRGGWPEYEKYGFQLPNTRYKTLSWDELKAQIDRNQPIGFSWEWRTCQSPKSYGSHYMVARGYIIVNNHQLVVVNDPWPVTTPDFEGGSFIIMTYLDYVKFCPRYVHSYTHFNIIKRERAPAPEPLCAYSTEGEEPAITGNTSDALQQAALLAIAILKALPGPILKALGFSSKPTFEKSSLGEPLSAYIDGSRRLREVTLDTPGNAIEVHYPLEIDGEPVTSITIRKRAGKWAFALIGDRRILLAAKARQETPLPRGVIPSYFMVDIQVFDLSFLAYFHEDMLYFIPTHEDPDLNLKLYQSTPAEEIFRELQYFMEQIAENTLEPVPGKKLIKFRKGMEKAIKGMESQKKKSVFKALKKAQKVLKQFFDIVDRRNQGPPKPKEN
jgi:hypothetical protein